MVHLIEAVVGQEAIALGLDIGDLRVHRSRQRRVLGGDHRDQVQVVLLELGRKIVTAVLVGECDENIALKIEPHGAERGEGGGSWKLCKRPYSPC